jgi:glycogen operon protein
MLIRGEASDDVDERGRPNEGQTLLLLLNSSNRAQQFALPRLYERGTWFEAVNTAQSAGRAPRRVPRTGVNVAPHSLVLLWYEVDE